MTRYEAKTSDKNCTNLMNQSISFPSHYLDMSAGNHHKKDGSVNGTKEVSCVIDMPNTRISVSDEHSDELDGKNAAPADEQAATTLLDACSFNRSQQPPPLPHACSPSGDTTTSSVPANSGSAGATITTTTPANLVRGVEFARVVTVLDALNVGQTVRTTNLMGASLQELVSTVADGDALNVSLYDIDGVNAGNAVVGLEAAGVITTTATTYTLIMAVKVMSEDYQYNMSLYGQKRFEVKWRDVTLLSTQVLFKPAPKLRPR